MRHSLLWNLVVVLALAGCTGESGLSLGRTPSHIWPPATSVEYPDLKLMDAVSGRRVSLSEYKGKVILLEPIGMNCPACNAFAGGHKVGSFRGQGLQKGLPSVEEILPRYAGIPLDQDGLVYVQLLLYNIQMKAPTLEEAKEYVGRGFVVIRGPRSVAPSSP